MTSSDSTHIVPHCPVGALHLQKQNMFLKGQTFEMFFKCDIELYIALYHTIERQNNPSETCLIRIQLIQVCIHSDFRFCEV